MFLFGFRLFRIALSQKCKVKVLYFLRCKSTFWNCLKLYMTQNFKSLPVLGRAFKVMKNGVYSIVITFLVAALFGILICASWRTCDVMMWTQWCKITKYGISANTKSTGLKFCRVNVLQELHIVIVVMI